ncbi:glycosyltransferase [Anaeromyxobacter terrae]|uniref:glycosyltransferase n=1 Tax=Anaeromyxobacter terrae TaxID=2925406 RepID=UPI001F59C543|nr:glycosyltransferase [Anaeromyxobacter sp. SG22]
MKVGHLSWVLSQAGGGIPPVAFAVAQAQRSEGADAQVFGVRHSSAATVSWGGVPTTECLVLGPTALGYAPRLRGSLAAFGPDVMHLHGLFTWPSQVARAWRRRTAGALLVSPHGMLHPMALTRSAWKKRLFRLAIEDANLRNAPCLHALTMAEASDIRRAGYRNPIAIIPNGVDAQLEHSSPGRSAFDDAFPATRSRRILLYMARLHPVKGLDRLIDAWALVQRDKAAGHSEWILVVAGPDQLGFGATMARRVHDLGIGERVLFTGPLQGFVKSAALRAADAFVLPSQHEAFSVALLEAMAAKLPAVVSAGCNFPVDQHGAGWVFEGTPESLARVLCELFSAPRMRLEEMGERGRALVESRYTWPKIGAELLSVYRWILGGGSPPSMVEVA